jgi:hypothetical protein
MDFTDYEYSSDSDCEEEYNAFCKKNAGFNMFIHQQTLMLSRLKFIENRIDNLAFTLEGVIDVLLAINKK